jgi:hypothetical protein
MADRPEYWALMWRQKDDWGWLSSLDANRDHTTQDGWRRLRYYSKDSAVAALWRFRRDNGRERDGETIRVVRVRVKLATPPEQAGGTK